MTIAKHIFDKMDESVIPLTGYFYIVGEYIVGEKNLDYQGDTGITHHTHFEFWAEEASNMYFNSTPELELATYGVERGRITYTGQLSDDGRILKPNGFNFFMTIGAKKFIPMISKMFNIKHPYSYVYINDEHYKIEESDKSITDSFNHKELDSYKFLIGKLRA